MHRSFVVLTLFVASAALAQSRPDAADRESALSSVLIPIAGDVSGANGTHFQTDVTLANRTQAYVRVGIYWLPQGRSGSIGVPLRELTLVPDSTLFLPRFVSDTLGETGNGAFFVRALSPDGTPNVNAHIDAFARIWTPAPNGAPGSYSQGIYGSSLRGPGVDDFQPIDGWVYGLRQDVFFRTNYGIVNLTDRPQTFDIVAVGSSGARFERTVTLPAASMIHDALPPTQNFGQVTIRISIHQLIPATLNLPWVAFGSSVDNRTGDAWYSKVQGAYAH